MKMVNMLYFLKPHLKKYDVFFVVGTSQNADAEGATVRIACEICVCVYVSVIPQLRVNCILFQSILQKSGHPVHENLGDSW